MWRVPKHDGTAAWSCELTHLLPPSAWEACARAPQAVRELRREIAAYAKPVGAGNENREAVMLAVSEALTNLVVHAYADRDPGPMIVQAWPDRGRASTGADL
jgi:Histidine kinase-like ATPase domain